MKWRVNGNLFVTLPRNFHCDGGNAAKTNYI